MTVITCPCGWSTTAANLAETSDKRRQHINDAHPPCRRIRNFMMNYGGVVCCGRPDGHDGDCYADGWRFPQPPPKHGYTTGNVKPTDDLPADARQQNHILDPSAWTLTEEIA